MTRILLIVFSFLSFNGYTQKFSSLELENIFTEAEIRDLRKLTDFFQEQMCYNIGDFKNCMDSIMPFLGESGWQPILENVDFSKQELLYTSFETTIFAEIWNFCKLTKAQDNKEVKSLCVNPSGKYVTFLESLAKKNKVIEAYKNDLLSAGDFFGIQRIEHEIYNKTNRIDLNDPGIQILLSIDYLTQNDQQKRNDPWLEN